MSSQQRTSVYCEPEIWGGVECSLNRVGESYMDQLDYSGHYMRGPEDIARFAGLGIRALRYPVLWERHQPLPDAPIDWRWTDQQLSAIRHHNLTPLIELVHHGSGPAYTSLLDASFALGLAKFAHEVATRYPWINDYTPVNEPLTTARFSGLYGLWYPHRRDDRSFVRMLFNQLHATVLSMQAIRRINPKARLVQTEDLTKIHSTPFLQYQADFENERRWLTYDLLCGKVNNRHPLWSYFLNYGIAEHELYFFLDHPCPPELIGVDYYCMSERYLDENLERYPEHYHGGNAQHAYADVPAIYVEHKKPSGLEQLMLECWQRYRLAMAVTEVFLDGSSHDQIRWLGCVWNVANRLCHRAVPVTAVTVWSLLGSYGWRNLLRSPCSDYEPGAFFVEDGHPNPTELARFIRQLAADPQAMHPALHTKGWWETAKRFRWDIDLTYATPPIKTTNIKGQNFK
jgi:dTDP-4-dehydrorhamnose reductase